MPTEILFAIVTSAVLCQVLHYKTDGFRLRDAFFPPTLREWVLPECPVCWVARAAIVVFAVEHIGAWS